MQDKEFAAILQDEPMQPLALVPLTEEEQVCSEHTNCQVEPFELVRNMSTRYDLSSKVSCSVG